MNNKPPPRPDERTPQQNFPNEFHPEISAASRKWTPSPDFPTFEHQIKGIIRICQELIAKREAKKNES